MKKLLLILPTLFIACTTPPKLPEPSKDDTGLATKLMQGGWTAYECSEDEDRSKYSALVCATKNFDRPCKMAKSRCPKKVDAMAYRLIGNPNKLHYSVSVEKAFSNKDADELSEMGLSDLKATLGQN